MHFFCRSEDAIRTYFASDGKTHPSSPKSIDLPPRFPTADDDTFKRWFPGLGLSRTACPAPQMRVVCFANAGNAEDMYTNEGTGIRRAPSPLLVGPVKIINCFYLASYTSSPLQTSKIRSWLLPFFSFLLSCECRNGAGSIQSSVLLPNILDEL